LYFINRFVRKPVSSCENLTFSTTTTTQKMSSLFEGVAQRSRPKTTTRLDLEVFGLRATDDEELPNTIADDDDNANDDDGEAEYALVNRDEARVHDAHIDDDERKQQEIYDYDDDDDDDDVDIEGLRRRSKSRSNESSPTSKRHRSAHVDGSTTTKKNAEKRRRLGLTDVDRPVLFSDRERTNAAAAAATGAVHLSNAALDAGDAVAVGEENILEPRMYTPFNPDATAWDDVTEQRHASRDDAWCHDCDQAQNDEQKEANPAIEEYRKHFEDNYLDVERTRLAGQVQKLYNLKVKPFNERTRVYTKRNISTHFEVHAPSPMILHAMDYRMMNFALKTMREEAIFQKDQDGNVTVKPKEMNTYLKVMKERNLVMNKLYKR
jgi:hypothetical protein